MYVYSREEAEAGIRRPGACAAPVRHVARERLNVGFAQIDRPVAVWFGGQDGKLPWMSMLRTCSSRFCDYEIVPTDAAVRFLDDE